MRHEQPPARRFPLSFATHVIVPLTIVSSSSLNVVPARRNGFPCFGFAGEKRASSESSTGLSVRSYVQLAVSGALSSAALFDSKPVLAKKAKPLVPPSSRRFTVTVLLLSAAVSVVWGVATNVVPSPRNKAAPELPVTIP